MHAFLRTDIVCAIILHIFDLLVTIRIDLKRIQTKSYEKKSGLTGFFGPVYHFMQR
jgi:hypothetical protein